MKSNLFKKSLPVLLLFIIAFGVVATSTATFSDYKVNTIAGTVHIPMDRIHEVNSVEIIKDYNEPISVEELAALIVVVGKDGLPYDDSYGPYEIDIYEGDLPDTTMEGTYKFPAYVDFPDGTWLEAEITVIVTDDRTEAELNEPEGQDVYIYATLEKDASEGIANKSELPDGTTYEWKEVPDSSVPNAVFDSIILVIYPDGSIDEVVVEVTISGLPSRSPVSDENTEEPEVLEEVTGEITREESDEVLESEDSPDLDIQSVDSPPGDLEDIPSIETIEDVQDNIIEEEANA